MKLPATLTFADDGLVPNNPLPVLFYEAAVDIADGHPHAKLEALFAGNGWGQDLWRNGIFDYLHYHATVHEVLGIARGNARVQLGGERGACLNVKAGDVVVLPAGTGHQRISASDDFSVVGGYPPGPTMQIARPTKSQHAAALRTIPQVPLPLSDPVFGDEGPLKRLWRPTLAR